MSNITAHAPNERWNLINSTKLTSIFDLSLRAIVIFTLSHGCELLLYSPMIVILDVHNEMTKVRDQSLSLLTGLITHGRQPLGSTDDIKQ